MKYYTILVWGDVEPETYGPYSSEEQRDEVSKTLRRDDPGLENGIFWADIWDNGTLQMGSYSGAFLV